MQEIRNMKELGAVIRSVRKAQKVNQTLLAQAANVGVRLIVDIERGKSTVQIDKLLAVMNRLGMTVCVDPPKGI